MRLIVIIIALLLMSGFIMMQLDQLALHNPDIAANIEIQLGEEDLTRYAKATEIRPLNFPNDLGTHPDYFLEWWYYTGNLMSGNGEEFGYQFTVFRRALASGETTRSSEWGSQQLYFAHFTVTDAVGETFSFYERFSRGGAGLAGVTADPYRVWLDDWEVAEIVGATSSILTASQLQGIPAQVHLKAHEADIGLDLTLALAKPVVLQGDKGLSKKSDVPGNASYYYSLTNQQTTGTITTPRGTFQVSGTSWKDHEWSTSQLPDNAVGWDWFSLKLTNGVEIMIFMIRLADGTVEPTSHGVMVLADGSTKPISAETTTIEPLSYWTSPYSEATYPIAWQFTIQNEAVDVKIEAVLPQQELRVSTTYWEGAVRVSGTHTGHGYVELTGYNESIQGRLQGTDN